jgi:hypothetical protein
MTFCSDKYVSRAEYDELKIRVDRLEAMLSCAHTHFGSATVLRIITSATAPPTAAVHTCTRSDHVYRGSPRPGTWVRPAGAVPPTVAAPSSRPGAGGARGAFPRGSDSAGLRCANGVTWGQLAPRQDGTATPRVARSRSGALRRPVNARAFLAKRPAPRPRASSTRRSCAPSADVRRASSSSASAAAAAATTAPADKKLPRADAHPAGRAPAPPHHSPRPSGRRPSSSSPPQILLQQQQQQQPQTSPISTRSPGSSLYRDRDHARLPPTPPPLPCATVQREEREQ